MLGAIAVAVLVGRIRFKALLIIGLIFQLFGYLVYGLSSDGLMVIIARILIGVNSGASFASVITYYNHSTAEYSMLAEKVNKKPIPGLYKTLVLVVALCGTIAYIPVIGMYYNTQIGSY